MANELEGLVMPWIGSARRHIPDDATFGVLEVRFAGRDPNNHWNDVGQPTFYLAADHGVALAELARH